MESSYKVIVVSSGSTYEFFKSSQYQEHRTIWNRIQEDGTLVENTAQAIQLVQEEEQMVFVYDGPTLQHIANKQPCDLTTGKY